MNTTARLGSVVLALIVVTAVTSGCAVGYPYYGNGYSRGYGSQPYYGGYRGGNGYAGYRHHHHHDDDDD